MEKNSLWSAVFFLAFLTPNHLKPSEVGNRCIELKQSDNMSKRLANLVTAWKVRSSEVKYNQYLNSYLICVYCSCISATPLPRIIVAFRENPMLKTRALSFLLMPQHI